MVSAAWFRVRRVDVGPPAALSVAPAPVQTKSAARAGESQGPSPPPSRTPAAAAASAVDSLLAWPGRAAGTRAYRDKEWNWETGVVEMRFPLLLQDHEMPGDFAFSADVESE